MFRCLFLAASMLPALSQAFTIDSSEFNTLSSSSEKATSQQHVYRQDSVVHQHTTKYLTQTQLQPTSAFSAQFSTEHVEQAAGFGYANNEQASQKHFGAAVQGALQLNDDLALRSKVAYASTEQQQVQSFQQAALSYRAQFANSNIAMNSEYSKSIRPSGLAWVVPMNNPSEFEGSELLKNDKQQIGLSFDSDRLHSRISGVKESNSAAAHGESQLRALELQANYRVNERVTLLSSVSPTKQQHKQRQLDESYVAYRSGLRVHKNAHWSSEWTLERGANNRVYVWNTTPEAQVANRHTLNLGESSLSMSIAQSLDEPAISALMQFDTHF
ncbi:hypothetical protein [Agaribacterium sp. ZY112]|uniref:hypothetical protein n=1 Tax=Agaribacterium sp. ZY112 TaxID=3233574 RepID=UPI003523D2ED